MTISSVFSSQKGGNDDDDERYSITRYNAVVMTVILINQKCATEQVTLKGGLTEGLTEE